MPVRPSGEKRRQRGVMATDAEWAAIRVQAEAAGLSISDHIMRVLVGAPASSVAGLPQSVVDRLVRAVLVLERLEAMRVEVQGGSDILQAVSAEIDAWLAAETAIERRGALS